ncbi:MAG: hypothetical protein DRR19_06630, partial [Candidatus Parabeggiatoa sp. nov. 1]
PLKRRGPIVQGSPGTPLKRRGPIVQGSPGTPLKRRGPVVQGSPETNDNMLTGRVSILRVNKYNG